MANVVRKRTDYCFTCCLSPENISISLWDVESGTTTRTYTSETGSIAKPGKGKAVSIALLGTSYLLCAPRTIPFIYVWNLKKASLKITDDLAGKIADTHDQSELAVANNILAAVA